ncbi:MAG: AI-2E family transporter [Thermodesulfovibrionales bacterium]
MSTTFWIKLTVFLLIVAGIIWFALSIGALVRVVIIAAILAYLINPLANWIEGRGVSRALTTITIFVAMISLIAVFLIIFMPLIIEEVKSAQQSLSTGQANVKLNKMITDLEQKLTYVGVHDFNIMEKIRGFFITVGQRVFNYLLDAVSIITHLIIIPFFSFFMVKDSRYIKKQFILMIPNRFFEFTINLLNKMDIQMGNYIRGQLLESTIIGTLAIAALWTLNVDYFILLGAFAGLINIVPYVGPIIGTIPPILASLYATGNLATAGYIALVFVIIQLIDNGVLKPVVVGKSVDLHPLMVLLAVIIGGKFFGILGMILSIPVTGFIKIIIHESMINFRKYRFS